MKDVSVAKMRFRQLAASRLKFSLFLLRYLPAAFFSGVRLRQLSEARCEVTVPYRWFSRNPFRSTYFACLAMAGELSTGALAMLHVRGVTTPVAMLVLDMKATFHKKAVGITRFTCEDGALLEQAVEAAVSLQQPQTYTARTTGVNDAGETVAVFEITWTFKART